MISVFFSLSSLLTGIGILLVGSGFLGTALGLRAGVEGFGDAITGLVMSSYFLGFILGAFVCPPLIRRTGHIRAFATLAAVASVTATAHGLWVTPWSWAALRLVNGVCVMGLFTVVESWINDVTPRERRGRVFSLYIAVTLAAGALAQLLILGVDIRALEPFALCAVLFSLGLVPVALTRLPQPEPTEAPSTGLGWLYRISPLGFAGTILSGLANSAFWGMGAVFAHRAGFSTLHLVSFMAATITGGAVLQWPIGQLSDLRDRRAVLIGVSFAGAGVSLLALALLPVSPIGVIACGFLYGGFGFSLYAVSVAHVNDHLGPGQVLEATRGLLLLYGLGATAGPTAAGIWMSAVGAPGLLLHFALCLGGLGLFGWHRCRVRPPVPATEQTAFVPLARTSPAVLELEPWTQNVEVTGEGPAK